MATLYFHHAFSAQDLQVLFSEITLVLASMMYYKQQKYGETKAVLCCRT